MTRADRTGRAFTYRHDLLGRFIYHPADGLSRHVLLYDFERPELEWAIDRARRGGVIVDVGANIGVFTAACARAAGAGGRVIALEPSPATFRKLQLTCERLQLANVELLRVAAAEKSGIRSFVVGDDTDPLRQHLSDARPSGPADVVPVEARTLDDICGERLADVSLVKVDVEGHEAEALAGAPRILANGRAALLVEIFPAALAAAGSSPERVRALLTRTHCCIAVITQDGRTAPGTGPWTVEPPFEKLDTCWVPA
jgi:FkbM family methyltransferase